jgi:glycosyltransferase involved in cell wall biosynthesis
MTAGKLKILMLNYEFPPIGGGAGKANLCLLKEFAKNESLEIDMLTSSTDPGLTVEKFADNITIYKLGIRKKNLHYWKKTEVIAWLFKAYFKHRNLVKNNNYDLAHAFFGFPTGFLPWLTASRLPYIISLRGSDVPGQNARLALEYKLLAPLFKAIWNKADAMVGCSKGLCDRARRFMPDIDYVVIPNGVDCQRFAPSRPHSLDKQVKLIAAGRLSSTKRFDMLIETVEILRQRGIDASLKLAGGGALHQSLQQMVISKNLQDNIQIAGRIAPDQMPGFYSQGDIFLSASVQEGMSNAMLEAMAASLPIIATQCEGVEELIADNGTVLQGPAPAEFADAVMDIIDDRTGYAAMSEAAAVRAAKFSWPSVADQYLRQYTSLITRIDGAK